VSLSRFVGISSSATGGDAPPIDAPGGAPARPDRTSRLRAAAAGVVAAAVAAAADAYRGGGGGAAGRDSDSDAEGGAPTSARAGGAAQDVLPSRYAALLALEVRTPDNVWTFCTLTPAARAHWVRVLRAGAERALTASTIHGDGGECGGAPGVGASTPGPPSAGGGAVGATGRGTLAGVAAKTHAAAEASAAAAALAPPGAAALLERLDSGAATARDVALALALARLRNRTCVDCGAPDPEWASISHGSVFCLACSGVHRALGVHVSKVRSLILDAWEPAHAAILLHVGNAAVNAVLLPRPPARAPPPLAPDAPRAAREAAIRLKYERLAFVTPPDAVAAEAAEDDGGTGVDSNYSAAAADADELLGRSLCASAARADLPGMLHAVAAGADAALVHFVSPRALGGGAPRLTSALHVAAATGRLSPVAFLMAQAAFSGEGGAVDGEGRTPVEALLLAALVPRAVRAPPAPRARAGTAGGSASPVAPPPPDGGAAHDDAAAALALALTPDFIGALVGILNKNARARVTAIANAAIEAARKGDVDAVLRVLDTERKARGV
jgi:hypothetical protein